jgi:hypothetical protein
MLTVVCGLDSSGWVETDDRYLTMLLGQICPAQRHAPGGVFWDGKEDEAERAGRDAIGVPLVAGHDQCHR